ncbi:MAG: twin-arginine translocase TatA/TatE family subunit [Blastocatellia bacterium]|nr:twin-arginine translocase TatA/TatE family subunit [Blastocatellia bacterium]
MFLFIFESIGTQELVLIGIVALMFLGPRKLPEYAKKIGRLMADFRSTTSDFKETWQREVNFEEEAKALRIDNLEDEPRVLPANTASDNQLAESKPEITPIDKEEFERRVASVRPDEPPETSPTEDIIEALPAGDKRNWL